MALHERLWERVLVHWGLAGQEQCLGWPRVKFNPARPGGTRDTANRSPPHLPEIQESLECPADPAKEEEERDGEEMKHPQPAGSPLFPEALWSPAHSSVVTWGRHYGELAGREKDGRGTS